MANNEVTVTTSVPIHLSEDESTDHEALLVQLLATASIPPPVRVPSSTLSNPSTSSLSTPEINEVPLVEPQPPVTVSPPNRTTEESRRLEKWLKKAKPLFDERQKPKTRQQALFSFLDAASEREQILFIQEHDQLIYQITIDLFTMRIDKMTKLRNEEAAESRNWTVQSKELGDFFKTATLLQRWMVACAAKLRVGWQRRSLMGVIQTFLAEGNHPRLRVTGFRLLLTWLALMQNDMNALGQEAIDLFQNVIYLAPFVKNDSVSVQQSPIQAVDKFIMVASPHSAQQDAVCLLETLLYEMTFERDVTEVFRQGSSSQMTAMQTGEYQSVADKDILNNASQFSAENNSSALLWSLFRRFYLTKLFPEVCKALKLLDANAQVGFVAGCPADIHSVLMRYVVRWTVEEGAEMVLARDLNLPEMPLVTPTATALHVSAPLTLNITFRALLCTKASNVALIHEMIRQSLLLPLAYTETMQMTLKLLKHWLTVKRPAFLTDETISLYTRAYIKYALFVFDGRPSLGHATLQLFLYNDALRFYRLLTTLKQTLETWQTLWHALLSIAESHLCPPNKYKMISHPTSAESFSRHLGAVLFTVIIRATVEMGQDYDWSNVEVLKEKEEFSILQGLWERSCRALTACTRWSLLVRLWLDLLLSLTRCMTLRLYGTIQDLHPVSNVTPSTSTRRLKQSLTPSLQQLAEKYHLPIEEHVHEEHPLEDHDALMIEEQEFKQWDGHCLLFLWRHVLMLLGNVNLIERPEIHASVMNGLAHVLDTLLLMETLPTASLIPVPAPLLAPWFIHCCDLSSVYGQGRAIAYGALCRLICRRTTRHSSFLNETLIAHFYRLLSQAYQERDPRVIQAVIVNGQGLFSLDCLPGSMILAGLFLQCAKRILVFDTNHTFNEETQCASVTLIASLVGRLIQFPDSPSSTSLKRELLDCLIHHSVPFNASLPGTVQFYSQSLFVLCHFMLEELVHQSKDSYVIEIITHFLHVIQTSDQRLARIALQCLNVLTEGDKLTSKTQIVWIVEKLLETLQEKLGNLSGSRENVLCALLFQSLGHWFMLLDESESTMTLQTTLFQLIEVAMKKGETVSNAAANSQPVSSSASVSSSKKSTFHLDSFRKTATTSTTTATNPASTPTGATSSNSATNSNALHSSPSASLLNEEDTSNDPIYESAECCLLLLLHHFHTWPIVSGGAIQSSPVDDFNEKVKFYALHNTSVLSVMEEEQLAQVVIRNMTGRYVWSVSRHNTTLPGPSENEKKIELKLGNLFSIEEEKTKPRLQRMTVNSDIETEQKVPPSLESIKAMDSNQVDKIQLLLDYLHHTHPDCVRQETDSTLTAPFSEPLQKFLEKEKEAVAPAFPVMKAPLPVEISSCSVLRPFLTQLLLLPLNLSPVQQPPPSLVPLQNSSALFRDLKGVDKRPERHCIKCALLYVSKECELDESSILACSQSSVDYQRFVQSLAWRVPVRQHAGYVAGLDRVQASNGESFPYYANVHYELAFHESVSMPLDAEHDPPHLKKKRHLGNDPIHIVWNEHERDYQRDTLRGDFANTVLVITPLQTLGLYAVQVLQDATRVQAVGPLQSGSVVTWPCLALMIRATVIQAHAALQLVAKDQWLRSPYILRQKELAQVLARHKQTKWTTPQILSHVLFG